MTSVAQDDSVTRAGAPALRSRGFRALLRAQWLGAFNDNLLKMVASLLAVGAGLSAGSASGYLSIAGVVLILPYLLFSGYAGYLADVLDKRSVLILAKAFEVLVALLALVALASARLDLLFAALFLMGAQSTFFSPARYGILPEVFHGADLQRANGRMELTRVLAVILGTAAGGAALSAWAQRPEIIGLALVALALAGFLASLGITAVPRSGARKTFRANPWGEIACGMARLAGDRVLRLVVAGITFFEFLAALVLLDLLLVAKEIMHLDDLRTGFLAVFVGLGMGLGSLAAGRLSGARSVTRLVPLGALGVGLSLVALSFSTRSYGQFLAVLPVLGFSGALLLIPLNTLLQRLAGREEKGRVIATNNFINMLGVLAASGGLWLLRDALGVRADGILFLAALAALALALGIFCASHALPARLWPGRRRTRTRPTAAAAPGPGIDR